MCVAIKKKKGGDNRGVVCEPTAAGRGGGLMGRCEDGRARLQSQVNFERDSKGRGLVGKREGETAEPPCSRISTPQVSKTIEKGTMLGCGKKVRSNVSK
jgi:hypothetical protein